MNPSFKLDTTTHVPPMQPMPGALVALLNKVEPGWIIYAHMIPTRVFRIVAKADFCTFRVERFVRTNRDNLNPQGMWHTESTHGDPQPGRMLQTACETAFKTQIDFINKTNAKMQARIAEQVRKVQPR